MKILVVEDNPITGRLFEKLIQALGYEVTTCANAEAALEIYQQTSYAMIVLDLGLPGMNGFEFSRRIRSLPQGEQTMILVITAYDEMKDLQAALEAGANDYLIKPVEMKLLQVRLTILERQLHNLTQRKRAEEALRQEKDFAEGLIETAPVIVLVLDSEGRIVRFNSYMEEISGYRLEEVQGQNWFTTFLSKRDQSWVQELFLKAVGGTRTRGNINPIVTKDGRERDIEWFDTTLKDAEGNIVGVLAIGQDVTERKRAEEALKRAYKELEETQQELIQSKTLAALGEFAAGLAHEIRNPLANIHASAQYCQKKNRSEDQLKKHLDIILRNSERADRVIKDLLDFARPRDLSFMLGDVGEIIDKACNLTEAKRSEYHVRLERKYAKDLPQILIDKMSMEQVFVNFILNALDAMKKGGGLSITVNAEGEELVITFADTGEGIQSQDLEKIFNPFYTTKPDGIGLGLSVTHRIIQAHKGKIDVESQVNEGTKVTVRLPISRER
jgi:PAS domain S-box-containing protein